MNLSEGDKKKILSLMDDGVKYLDSLAEAYSDDKNGKWYKKYLSDSIKGREFVKKITSLFNASKKEKSQDEFTRGVGVALSCIAGGVGFDHPNLAQSALSDLGYTKKDLLKAGVEKQDIRKIFK